MTSYEQYPYPTPAPYPTATQPAPRRRGTGSGRRRRRRRAARRRRWCGPRRHPRRRLDRADERGRYDDDADRPVPLRRGHRRLGRRRRHPERRDRQCPGHQLGRDGLGRHPDQRRHHPDQQPRGRRRRGRHDHGGVLRRDPAPATVVGADPAPTSPSSRRRTCRGSRRPASRTPTPSSSGNSSSPSASPLGLRRHRDLRCRQCGGPPGADRRQRQPGRSRCDPDRRRDQPRQLRRGPAQRRRQGDRDQLGHRHRVRRQLRQHRRRFRDPQQHRTAGGGPADPGRRGHPRPARCRGGDLRRRADRPVPSCAP